MIIADKKKSNYGYEKQLLIHLYFRTIEEIRTFANFTAVTDKIKLYAVLL